MQVFLLPEVNLAEVLEGGHVLLVVRPGTPDVPHPVRMSEIRAVYKVGDGTCPIVHLK